MTLKQTYVLHLLTKSLWHSIYFSNLKNTPYKVTIHYIQLLDMEDIWEWIHLTSGTRQIISRKKMLMSPWVFNMTALHRPTDNYKTNFIDEYTSAHWSRTEKVREIERIKERKWKEKKYISQNLHKTISFYYLWLPIEHRIKFQYPYTASFLPHNLGSGFLSELITCHLPLGILYILYSH